MNKPVKVELQFTEDQLEVIDLGAQNLGMDRAMFLVWASNTAINRSVLDRIESAEICLPEESIRALHKYAEQMPEPNSELWDALSLYHEVVIEGEQ